MSSRSSHSHIYYQDLLDKHVAGVPIPPDARIALFDHVEACDECRRILEAEERVTERVKAVPRFIMPSDMRAKILSQAVRSHQERTTTPTEDPHVADLLTSKENLPEEPATPAEGTPAPQPPARPVPLPRKPGVTPIPVNRPSNDELPVFAGITRPRVSKSKRLWQRTSPVLAMSFLTLATVGALYTGQFQGIPVAEQAQQQVWATVDSLIGREPLPSARDDNSAGRVEIADVSPIVMPMDFGLPETPTDDASADTNSPAGPTAAADTPQVPPLPGTDKLVAGMQQARAWAASVDSTLTALARAAEPVVPAPAETAQPQIAALVLKPTDAGNGAGGFQESQLASALESMANSQPGGRLASRDQFAEGGHRYRLYTMELPAGSTDKLVEKLTPYQASEDRQIVNTLASQNHITLTRNRGVRFFSSNEAHLRSAIQLTGGGASPTQHGKERVQFVVVE